MEGVFLDNRERQDDRTLTIDKDAQINVVVNHPGEDEDSIDLGRVFHNMKLRSRIYAWVLVLCMVVGICAPLLMYQFSKPMLTVSSVVSLNFGGDNLTAPDGSALDLSQVTGSYVLQKALSGLELSQPVSVSNLKKNLSVQRVLTEDSRRLQEVAAKMVEDKNASAYTAAPNAQSTYDHRFLVSLTNGFGDEDAKVKYELQDAELRTVLDRVLSAYNDYLVLTYAPLTLPDDELSVIDLDNLDVMEALDQMRTAEENLMDYCQKLPADMRAYRSYRTGRTLTDWMSTLQTGRSVSIDYLYSYVYTNSIVRDKENTLNRYEYQLQVTQNQLDTVNEKIRTNKDILANYKNDEIYVSSQESETSRVATTTTDYYNALVLQQASNFERVADLENRIEDLQDKIAVLKGEGGIAYDESVAQELKTVLDTCLLVQEGIRDHITELQQTTGYNAYAEHTVPQGKSDSFLSANMKKIIIGAVAGAVIGCGLWFLAGLAPEFRRNREDSEDRKEAQKA